MLQVMENEEQQKKLVKIRVSDFEFCYQMYDGKFITLQEEIRIASDTPHTARFLAKKKFKKFLRKGFKSGDWYYPPAAIRRGVLTLRRSATKEQWELDFCDRHA